MADKMNNHKGCEICAKIFLVVINMVFFLIGCAVFSVGIIIHFGNSLWSTHMKPILQFIPQIADKANITSSFSWTQEEIDNMSVDIKGISSTLPVALVVCGILLASMGILGCLILCCFDVVLFILYCVILGVFVVAQTLLVVMFWIGLINPFLKEQLRKTLTDGYYSSDANTAIAMSWTYVMLQHECCGLDGYTNFHGSVWEVNRNRTAFRTDGLLYRIRLDAPMACCKFSGTFPDEAIYVNFSTCLYADGFSTTNSNYNVGCWNAISSNLEGQKLLAMALSIALVIIQVLMWIAAIIVFCKCVNKNNKVASEEEIDPDTNNPETRKSSPSIEKDMSSFNKDQNDEPYRQAAKTKYAFHHYIKAKDKKTIVRNEITNDARMSENIMNKPTVSNDLVGSKLAINDVEW